MHPHARNSNPCTSKNSGLIPVDKKKKNIIKNFQQNQMQEEKKNNIQTHHTMIIKELTTLKNDILVNSICQ